jgi:glycosyltransferase involved in cell wall biosynthesis
MRVRYGIELSLQLIEALRAEVRKDERLLLHLHGIFNLGTYSAALKFGGKLPIAAQSHDPIPSVHRQLAGLQNSLRRYALHNVNRFFLSSENEARAFSGVCDLSKVRLTPMPVDTKVFHRTDKRKARMKLGWKDNEHYAIYVGRLEERKGVRYLIEASRMLATRFPNLHVMAVGSGRLSTEAENDLRLVGQVGYGELPTYYNAADICVLPSLGESWGRVVLESLACQTPIIATMTGCVPTLVTEGVEGLFTVPMRDAAALAVRISEVLPRSEELRSRIDRTKIETYDSDIFVGRMLVNYEELASVPTDHLTDG